MSTLPRDRDVFEQFERLCSLITTNYQAYLFGTKYKECSSQLEHSKMPKNDLVLEAYFDTKASYLVQKPVKPDQFTSWLFPKKFTPINVSCVLLGGPSDNMTAEFLIFNAEKEVGKLIEVKGRTLGRSTDLDSDRNIHVTGFPKTLENPREVVAVVKDRWRTGPGTMMRWSELDCVHAIHGEGQYVKEF